MVTRDMGAVIPDTALVTRDTGAAATPDTAPGILVIREIGLATPVIRVGVPAIQVAVRATQVGVRAIPAHSRLIGLILPQTILI